MSWAQPAWALGFLAVLLLGLLVWVSGRNHRARIAAWFGGEMYARVLPARVRARRLGRDLLALGGLACLVLALIEPLYGKDVQEIERKGVDLVLVVDLSRSMDCRDVDPSRLERARREIFDLIGFMESDRVGMVVFAGGAYPRMPLTQDHDALRMLVEEMDTDVFQAQGSEVGEAIRMATELLSGEASRRAGRAIVLLSDGESADPADALAAARDAEEAGIRIYTVGVGVEPAPVPTPQGGFMTQGGKTVMSTPDPKLLRDLARVSGGAYVQSVAAASDMESLYRDEIRKSLEATQYGVIEQEAWKSGFQWPLGLGLIALLLAGWLGDGRRPWGGVAAALLAVLLVPPDALAATRAEGDALYQAGQYSQAEEVFTELSMERPTDPDVFDRLGAARYRQEDYEGAARAWDAAAELRGREGAEERFNSGNAYYKAGRLEEALQRYDQVLNEEPDHEGARENQGVVRKELAYRREQQPEQDQQDQGTGEEGQQGDQEQQQGAQGEQQQGEQQQGEQQEGDQQQQGEGQAGEQGDQPPQGAQGEPQDTESQQGSGEPEETSDAQSDTEGNKQPGDDGQQMQGEESSGTAELDELDETTGPLAEGEPFDGRWQNDGPVTAQQAERLLEGVEEGRPRIVVPGRDRGRPW